MNDEMDVSTHTANDNKVLSDGLFKAYQELLVESIKVARLTSPSSEFFLDVAKGNVVGHSDIHKFGKNEDVSTTIFDTIWNGGGSYTGFDAVGAETVTIVSGSANDTAAGTGLRTLRLYGLDANGLQQTEDVTLSGTGTTTSTLTYLRLDRARGLTAGSLGHNEGDITIRQSVTTAVIFAVVPATYNTTMIAAYTIPFDKTGYITTQAVSIANKQSAFVDVRLQVRGPGSVFTVNGEAAVSSTGTGFIERKFETPPKLPAGTDLFIEGKASASVAVAAFLDILLVDNY